MIRCPVCDAPKDPAVHADDAWHLLVCGLPMSEWPRSYSSGGVRKREDFLRDLDLRRLINIVGSVVEEMAG